MKIPELFKYEPVVFAVGNEYQIFVRVTKPSLMWVMVGEEEYYDDSNGILRSNVTLHKICVPCDELNKAKEYTICWRKIIERKPYFTETEQIEQLTFKFQPIGCDNVRAYQIADAHNMVEEPVKAVELFEKKYGKIDFLILNGDVIDHSGRIENFDNLYEIAGKIGHGKIPVICSRGNHDTRGYYAENIAEYMPSRNGVSYYEFKLGNIWGLVLDCGEDKVDSHEEYGNTVCCHAFRKRETKFLKETLEKRKTQFEQDGIDHKIVIVHNPFTVVQENPIFNIEQEIFGYWSKLLADEFKIDLMISGHFHKQKVSYPGDEDELHKHPCPIIIGTKPFTGDGHLRFYGNGIVFNKYSYTVVFNDSDNDCWNEIVIDR